MATPVYLPSKLPPYLKSVYNLKPIIGTPSDNEVIGIHAVIRMAQKAVDILGTGDPALLAQLYEHLFDIQIAKYRNRYLSVVFPETTTYTPPTLPAHIAVQLESVTGAPCEEEVMKVQSAIRSYDQFANGKQIIASVSTLRSSGGDEAFTTSVRYPDGYTVRVNDRHVSQSVQRPSSNCTRESSSSCTRIAEQSMAADSGASTNNAGIGTVVADFHASTEGQRGIDPQNAIERSNQLVEQTNQLIERSNQIAERANQLVDKCSHPAEQSNKLLERFSQLFERLNEHLDQSNRVNKESMQPVEKIGDVLRNINRVLVRIQHAIVRNHKGNTIRALECLVNEKGETPSMSFTTKNRTYSDFSEHSVPVVIDGVSQNSYMCDSWLGEFLRFYGIGGELFDDTTTVYLKEEKLKKARIRLSEYLTSCLG